jgi:hypothetical protein
MTFDGADPLSALLAARIAFGNSTEAERLLEITERALHLGKVDWLEIGAGDGRHLAHQLERLSAKRKIRIVALEPSPYASPDSPRAFTWLSRRVEDYNPDRQFSWVNMRHSAYYLTDPVGQIQRVSTWLSNRGAIALTHWSRNCVLHRLHCKIYGLAPDAGCIAIEDLAAALASDPRLIISDIDYSDTKLLIEKVAGDQKIASAVFELARRGRRSRVPDGTNKADFIVQALHTLPDAAKRRNGIIVVKVRPN